MKTGTEDRLAFGKCAGNRTGAALGDRAERFLLQGRDAAFVVLRPGIADVNVLPGGLGDRMARPDQFAQAIGDLLRDTTIIEPRLASQPFKGLGKDRRASGSDVMVEEVTHQRVCDDARGGIRVPAFGCDHQIGERARRARRRLEVFKKVASLFDRGACHRGAVLPPALQGKPRDGPPRRRDGLLYSVREPVIGGKDQDRAGVGMGREGPQHMSVEDLVGAHVTASVGAGDQNGLGKSFGHAPRPGSVQAAHRQDHEVIADTRPAGGAWETLETVHRNPPRRLWRWT